MAAAVGDALGPAVSASREGAGGGTMTGSPSEGAEPPTSGLAAAGGSTEADVLSSPEMPAVAAPTSGPCEGASVVETGEPVGPLVGVADGAALGFAEGAPDGAVEGKRVGAGVGRAVKMGTSAACRWVGIGI